MARPKARIRTVLVHAVVALVAFVFDGLLWGGPALGFLLASVGGTMGLIQLLRGLLGQRDRLLAGGLVIASYSGAMVLVMTAVAIHRTGAQTRAAPVIRALDAYRAARGAYPRELSELVPAYIPGIPRAKYTLWMSEYWFIPSSEKGTPELGFSEFSPLGGTCFDLETRRWMTID